MAAKAKGKTPKKGKATPKRNAKSRKEAAEAEARAGMTKEQLRASGTKKRPSDANPVWFKPIMFGFLILGFLWIIVYYLSSGFLPVRTLGDWNILVGFGIALVGFLMMTNWK
ncbi:MAG: cell division protein CrgA [Gulosibacter sp.]|uniref:cell division protein CrgA n=1 Tax=Gulosibacter sp. TaxID=2817531 RepID=UPI003F8DA1F1